MAGSLLASIDVFFSVDLGLFLKKKKSIKIKKLREDNFLISWAHCVSFYYVCLRPLPCHLFWAEPGRSQGGANAAGAPSTKSNLGYVLFTQSSFWHTAVIKAGHQFAYASTRIGQPKHALAITAGLWWRTARRQYEPVASKHLSKQQARLEPLRPCWMAESVCSITLYNFTKVNIIGTGTQVPNTNFLEKARKSESACLKMCRSPFPCLRQKPGKIVAAIIYVFI